MNPSQQDDPPYCHLPLGKYYYHIINIYILLLAALLVWPATSHKSHKITTNVPTLVGLAGQTCAYAFWMNNSLLCVSFMTAGASQVVLTMTNACSRGIQYYSIMRCSVSNQGGKSLSKINLHHLTKKIKGRWTELCSVVSQHTFRQLELLLQPLTCYDWCY